MARPAHCVFRRGDEGISFKRPLLGKFIMAMR
jgi:hypothetical protein